MYALDISNFIFYNFENTYFDFLSLLKIPKILHQNKDVWIAKEGNIDFNDIIYRYRNYLYELSPILVTVTVEYPFSAFISKFL